MALTDFAIVDPGIMGLNLFRPLPRRGREAARKRMFEVDTVHDGRKLRVVGAYTLGADDLAILLAVLALAGLVGKKIEAGLTDSMRVDIVDGLESTGDVVDSIHIRVTTTLYAICREAGISINGDAYERVSDSLMRMRAVHYNDLGPAGSNSRRLSATGKQNLIIARAREDTGEIAVVINARFAAVILGPPFGRIDLNEARSLGEMGRLLHLRLSVMIRQGKGLTVTTDKLGEWVYGGEARSVRERQNRRKEARQGLAELAALPNWEVVENRRRAMVSVARAPRAAPDVATLRLAA